MIGDEFEIGSIYGFVVEIIGWIVVMDVDGECFCYYMNSLLVDLEILIGLID